MGKIVSAFPKTEEVHRIWLVNDECVQKPCGKRFMRRWRCGKVDLESRCAEYMLRNYLQRQKCCVVPEVGVYCQDRRGGCSANIASRMMLYVQLFRNPE